MKRKNLCSEKCTGCSACANICPVNAINMTRNNEGFIESNIDTELCINCGKCENICPVNHPHYTNEIAKCYAFMAEDDIRRVSSSGGFFSTLAKYFIDNEGYVVGAVYRDDSFQVIHKITNNWEEVEHMRGSKYIQSDCSFVFPEIRDLLDNGKMVLFTGMPCQIAGLYAFLNKDYYNLCTCELVCHGITSYKVFEKYNEDVLARKIKNIEFKKKTPWGWHAGINAEFDDGSSYIVPAEDDPYFCAYLKGISKNKSCEDCVFNKLPRQADLTMGDFWRIDQYDRNLNDNLGTSLVLTNNAKGAMIWDKVKCKGKLAKEVPLEFGIAGNKSLEAPYKVHFRRRKFFDDLNYISFQKLVDHCEKDKFDFGIVGLWYGLNYGSILTYYALGMMLKKMGYDSLFVNKPNFIWQSKYSEINSLGQSFIRKHFVVSGIHEYERYRLLNDHCDGFIVGSDVVWNYNICGREAQNFFFLDFVNDNKKKISIASSFGGKYEAPETDRYMNQRYISRFDGVSVREKRGVQICKEEFGVNAQIILDPVFLCDKSVFAEIMDDSCVVSGNDGYIMTYLLGGGEVKQEQIKEIASFLSCNHVVDVPNPNNPSKSKEQYSDLEMTDVISVEQWLGLLNNSNMFIGDSFHGLCFSIIFRKPFVCIVSKKMPSIDRFETLLSICGLENRLWYSDEDNSGKYEILKSEIDYDQVYQRLENYRNDSLQWITNTINKEKSKKMTYQDSVDKTEFEKLAIAAEENSHGREIITWGKSDAFESCLQELFGKKVSFWIAKDNSHVDNVNSFPYEIIAGKSDRYFIVIPDIAWAEQDAKNLADNGFKEGKDYIYRNHRPIVLNGLKYKHYFDCYGNVVKSNGINARLVKLSGFNNEIEIGRNNDFVNTSIEMSGNSQLLIGEGNRIENINIIFRGGTKKKNTIKIKNRVAFDGGNLTLWGSPKQYSNEEQYDILIDDDCTFGKGIDISVNSGCKLKIGKDCMFSYDIKVQSGDGHAIFDVNSGRRLNISSENTLSDKYEIVLGDHTWISKGAFLLHGTKVGKGSIIGAMSVVKGKFPNNVAIAGNPARIIHKDIAWARDNETEDPHRCGWEFYSKTICDEDELRNKRKVLILGGTGRMSHKLTSLCIEEGDDVTIASRGNHKGDFLPVKKIIFDRFNIEETKRLLSGTKWDVVFDCSGYAPQCVDAVLSSINARRYIYVSSFAVYARFNPGLNRREDDIELSGKEYYEYVNPSDYSLSKLHAELLIANKYHGINYAIVRIPFVMSSENDFSDALSSRMGKYVEAVEANMPINSNNLDYRFNFVESNDEANFLNFLSKNDFKGVVNFASQGDISMREVIAYAEGLTGKKAILDADAKLFPFTNHPEVTMDLSRCMDMGYRPMLLNNWLMGEEKNKIHDYVMNYRLK